MEEEIARLREEALQMRKGLLVASCHFLDALPGVQEFFSWALLSAAGSAVLKGGI